MLFYQSREKGEKKGETRQAATKEHTEPLRGFRHCCTGSKEAKLLKKMYNPARLETITCTQITACFLSTQTNYNAFAVISILFHAAKDSIAPLNCHLYYSTAPVLHMHSCFIPLH